MTFCFYPYVNGDIATSDGRLFFLFLPDRAIDSRDEYRFDLYREAQYDLIDIYSDSVFPARGVKSSAPDTISLLSNRISELPYLTKLLFFGVLDKYANLYVQRELESKGNEVKIWKRLLTYDFYESTLKPAIQDIPDAVGEYIRHSAAWIYKDLAHNGPRSPEVMRELRNSYPGWHPAHRQIAKPFGRIE